MHKFAFHERAVFSLSLLLQSILVPLVQQIPPSKDTSGIWVLSVVEHPVVLSFLFPTPKWYRLDGRARGAEICAASCGAERAGACPLSGSASKSSTDRATEPPPPCSVTSNTACVRVASGLGSPRLQPAGDGVQGGLRAPRPQQDGRCLFEGVSPPTVPGLLAAPASSPVTGRLGSEPLTLAERCRSRRRSHREGTAAQAAASYRAGGGCGSPRSRHNLHGLLKPQLRRSSVPHCSSWLIFGALLCSVCVPSSDRLRGTSFFVPNVLFK